MNQWQQWCARALGTGLVAWTACAAGDEPARETRQISQPFNEVRLIGDFDLELSQADTVSLVVEGPRDELPTIRSDVADGVLTLGRTDSGGLTFSHWFSKHRAVRATLSAPAIDRLVVDGSGSVHAGTWTSHALELRTSGSGDTRLDHLTAERLHSELLGSGNILVAGSVASQRLRLAGSGSYRAPELKSDAAAVSITGSGTAELWVARTLDARVIGSGDVRYYGTPSVTRSVAGSGAVTAMGEKNSP